MKSFASDNFSGIHPKVYEKILSINTNHDIAYGDDSVTSKLKEHIQNVFSEDVSIFPVLTGTSANVISLSAMTQKWEGVICANTSHINVDEGGAPEKVAGIKLLGVEDQNGKLTAELIDSLMYAKGIVHHCQPGVVSISQPTECGTVYTVAELKEIVEYSRSQGLKVHMDGSRLFNAAAYLGVSFKEMTLDIGVDIVSLGGTKNGAMGAEAILVFNPEYKQIVEFTRKTYMCLSSKMRFISAQIIALLQDEVGLENAEHSNAMATLLFKKVKNIKNVFIDFPVQTNVVFARLPKKAVEGLLQKYHFYIWDNEKNLVRWMCSWDTTSEEVCTFVEDIVHQMSQL